jgi:hypothetical protein
LVRVFWIVKTFPDSDSSRPQRLILPSRERSIPLTNGGDHAFTALEQIALDRGGSFWLSEAPS